jgi:hypothetical protein
MLTGHAAFVVAALSGFLAFGHGFGDVIYLLFSIFSWLLFAGFFAFMDSEHFVKWHTALSVSITVVFVLLCLKATFFRGPEYPWQNHGIFYR